ncbi:hypothetical protein ACWD1Y_45050 [Streptomyces sp. NPDC002814]
MQRAVPQPAARARPLTASDAAQAGSNHSDLRSGTPDGLSCYGTYSAGAAAATADGPVPWPRPRDAVSAAAPAVEHKAQQGVSDTVDDEPARPMRLTPWSAGLPAGEMSVTE